MKKKPFKKFKPLQALYNHENNTLLNSKEILVVKNHLSSRKNSSSKALQSSNSLKNRSSFEDQTMIENVLTKSTLDRQSQDVVDCQGDDISCLSKEDGEVMKSGADSLEKSLISESVRNGSLVDHMLVEGVDHKSMRPHSSGAILPAKCFGDELNFNSPITSVQNENVIPEDQSLELVDVRVCDICGDAGREALLALCSKCSDGAEHIYCMTPKLDEVPVSDWVCEDCSLIREPKRHQQAMFKRSSNVSKELSQGSRLSDKRLGPSKDGSVRPKKRSFDQRVDSGKQTRLTQFSSLKNMDKRKDSAKKVMMQAGASRYSSPERERHFGGGKNMEVQCSMEDIHQRKSFSKENDAHEPKKKRSDKKVLKSLSLTGIDRISRDVSNALSSEKSSQEKKTSQLRQTREVSKTFKKGNSSRKNVGDKNVIQIHGNTNVSPLESRASEDENWMNTLGAGSVEKMNSPCHSNYVVNSLAVKGDAYSNQRVSLSTQKANVDNHDDQSLAAYKIMPTLNPVDIDHTVPSTFPAIPDSKAIWKGRFKLGKNGKLLSDCYEVQAHLSTQASSKVDELVFSFFTELKLKEVPWVNVWPIQFQKNHPTEDDIALYFFAQDLSSYERSYRKLLDGMTSNDLALEANFGDFQLLVFPSNLLPKNLQRWNSLLYLWGVFRRKPHDSCYPNLKVTPENQYLGSQVTTGSESKFVSPPVSETGNVFPSHTSNKSKEGEEFVDPIVLQSLTLMESRDQISEVEVPSMEEYNLEEHQLQAGNIMFSDDWGADDLDGGLQSNDLQKERRFSDENVKIVSNADIFIRGKSISPIGLSSDVGCGSPLSLDSGPSGLSDSGWCAKSAYEEPFDNPESFDNTLNLDLSLKNRSRSDEEDLDLDLTLALPSAYKPNDHLDGSSYQDGNVSLELCLGMPCSNC